MPGPYSRPRSQRTKAQRDDDRAMLLAALGEATKPLTPEQLVHVAWDGVPDTKTLSRAATDLRALIKIGQVYEDQTTWPYRYRIFQRGDVQRADLWEDERDIYRQMRAWQEVEHDG
jgi:hypothetical protein